MFHGRSPGFELVHQYAFEVVDFSSQYGSENDTNYTAENLVGPCQVYPNYCDSSATCSFRHFGRWPQLCSSALKPISSPPDGYTSADYVDLFFDVPVVPTRIQVFETYNPGAIVRILACYRSQPAHEPVNARKLHWVTLWTAPRSRSSNVGGVPTPRQLQLQYTSSESDPDNSRALALTTLGLRHCSPNFSSDGPSYFEFREHLYSSQFQEHLGCAPIFQPPLTNVPPFPTDLIRIELDSGRCGYYPELDAVRLTGWAEVSRWSGFTQLEDTVTHDSSQTIHSSPRVGPHASFFSELLRPRTPHLCIPSDGCPPNTESMDVSISALSPISSPDASPNRPSMLPFSNPSCTSQVLSGALIQPSMYSGALRTLPDNGGSSSLCRLPLVGLDMLLPRVGHIVAVSPGLICPVSLFGLMHLDETAPWRHGPLTRLPYEILLKIFTFLDLRSLCQAAYVSRQFRCLADDALARLTSLNLQAYWPWLTDTGLLSLGKRLGRVNLAALVAAAVTTGNSVAPFNLLRRLEAEEMPQRRLRPRQLAARVRTLSAGTTTVGLMGYDSDGAQSLAAQCPDHTNLQSDSHCVSQVPDSPQCNSPNACDRHPTSDLSADFLEAYKQAFPPCRLRRLDMSWCGNYSQISPNAFGVFLGDSCRHLVTLRLSSCKFLNDDCLLHVVNNCPHLQELDLSSCTGITAHGFLTLSRLIHLNWLSLYRTHITDDGLLSVSELCQHLQHVNLGSCVDVQDMDLVLDHLTRNNPGLRSLNLWRCTTVSAIGIEHIAVSCPLLEELDVGWCLTIAPTQEANNCIVRLVQQCGGIRQLHLTGTSLLNSEELVFVGRRLGTQLEQLNIRGSDHVTSSAIALLLNHCPRLRLLDISFCAQVQLHSVIQLRQLFPFCTIISAIRDLTADVFDTTVHQVIVDEVVDDLENPFAFLQGIFVPPALPGRPELLALPAPNPLPAIAGPPAN